MKKLFFVVVLVLALSLVACENDLAIFGDQTEESPSAQTTSFEAIPVESDPEQLMLSGNCTYINWENDKFRQNDGTYVVPVSWLYHQAGGVYPIIFEGESFDAIGIHKICMIGECPFESEKDTNIHINQGSFWACPEVSYGGNTPDDLKLTFAMDKHKNWQEQGIKGNPIWVWVSTGGVKKFDAGVAPALSSVQKELVLQNATERCPANTAVVLEVPFSDAMSKDKIVVGAPGSYSCRTLFFGQVVPGGKKLAYYWRGARDNFSYVAKGAFFYLVPESWGESDMQNFVGNDVKLMAQ